MSGLTYVGDSNVHDSQIKYVGTNDPRGLLKEGVEYIPDSIEVFSWHTIVTLKEFPEKRFNSVHFNEL